MKSKKRKILQHSDLYFFQICLVINHLVLLSSFSLLRMSKHAEFGTLEASLIQMINDHNQRSVQLREFTGVYIPCMFNY